MFTVYYNSVGCLPETEPMEFDCIEDAANHIVSEYMECIDNYGLADTASLIDTEYVLNSWLVHSPVPNSLYRWSIEAN